MAKTKTASRTKTPTRKHGPPRTKSPSHRKAASTTSSPKSGSRGAVPSGIPATIARSDRDAQSFWRKTRTSAIKTYGDGARASCVALSALKRE